MKPELPMKSEKLETVAAQITQLLQDNDLAGIVVLQEPTHIKFLMKLDPSYSIAYMDGTKFKIRPPNVHETTEQAAMVKVKGTINMMANLRFKLNQIGAALLQAEVAVRQQFGVPFPSGGQKGLNGGGSSDGGSVIPFTPPKS